MTGRVKKIRADWGAPRVRERRFDAILASHRARCEADSSQSLDDRTWSDLNLDDLFVKADRTESTVGQHALYHRLRTVPLAPHLDAFEALVARFSTDQRLRERAQLALVPLQDPRGYDLWWLKGSSVEDPPAWQTIFPFLTALSVIAIAAGFGLHLTPLVVAVLAVNAAVNLATVSRRDADATALRQIAPLIKAADALMFLNHDDSRPLLGELQNTPAVRHMKAIARWAGDNPFLLTLDSSYGAVMFNDFIKVVYEYLSMFFLVDRTAVFFGRRQLRANGARIVGILASIGEVDAAISVASLRAESTRWTRPQFISSGSVHINLVHHPLVEDAIANSITLAPPHGLLVTGSNMSGKTTWLRTLGVAAVTAQTINTCFAERYEAPALRVRSVIGRADDIMSGRSYYLVEVEALLALVRASESADPHLFLLDELFRGTNAVERIAAGEAVLRELILEHERYKPHVVIAATHDSEMVNMLEGSYAPYHFGDAIGANGLVFDYMLTPGPATTRNAITLLQLEGAPEALVERALKTAAALDRARAPTF